MRFSTLVSSLLCFTSALGVSLHQHVVKRTSSDLCVSLDLNLNLNHHSFGHLDACVCLSTIDFFIATNVQIQAAIRTHKTTKKQVEEYLFDKILSHSKRQKCHYPQHAKPAPAAKCHPHSDPCDFSCQDGFVANHRSRTCDCPRPNIVYNGRCIPKPGKPGGGKGPQPSHKPAPPRHAPPPPHHAPPPPPPHHAPPPPPPHGHY